MTQEQFKDLIEAPSKSIHDIIDVRSTGVPMSNTIFKVFTKSLIARTVRLTLQYPEEAQEYFDSLSKAVNENIPTPSKTNIHIENNNGIVII